MGKLFYTIELIIVFIAAIWCSVNNLISGCDFIRINGEYTVGILTIILSIAAAVLGLAYYQFYKLVDQ